MMYGWGYETGHGWEMALWMLVSVAVVIAVVWIAVWAARRDGDRPAQNAARQILDERYARGEIDADEYRTHVNVLSSTTSAPGKAAR